MYNTTTIRIGRAILTFKLIERKDSYLLVVGEVDSLWKAQDALRKAGDGAAAKRLEMQCRALAHRACANCMLLAEAEGYHKAASAVYVEGSTVVVELSDGDSATMTERLLADVMQLVERDARELP